MAALNIYLTFSLVVINNNKAFQQDMIFGKEMSYASTKFCMYRTAVVTIYIGGNYAHRQT